MYIKQLLTMLIVGIILTGCGNDVKTEVDTSENLPLIQVEPVIKDTLYAYTLDYDKMLNIPIEIEVEHTGDIMSSIEKLATVLSDKIFNGLEILIVQKEDINGKEIVTINLQDSDKGEWYNYFQGSTGGMVTTKTLEETFLQRDYTGEWIDGIQFQYNGDPMPEFDHTIGLDTIIYR